MPRIVPELLQNTERRNQNLVSRPVLKGSVSWVNSLGFSNSIMRISGVLAVVKHCAILACIPLHLCGIICERVNTPANLCLFFIGDLLVAYLHTYPWISQRVCIIIPSSVAAAGKPNAFCCRSPGVDYAGPSTCKMQMQKLWMGCALHGRNIVAAHKLYLSLRTFCLKWFEAPIL